MRTAQLSSIRNAAGQPRPVDVPAVILLAPQEAMSYVDNLLGVASKRRDTVPKEQADTFGELLDIASKAADSAHKALEAEKSRADRPKRSAKADTATAADYLRDALIVLGDASLMLQAVGAVLSSKPAGLYAPAIFEARRKAAVR